MDRLVHDLTDDDRGRPTPCDGWDVADLLAHQVGQTAGMAAALENGDAPLEAYAARPFDNAAWRAGLSALNRARLQTTPDTLVLQRELSKVPIPRSFVWRALAVDFAVHAWDLAVALDRDLRPSRALAEHILQVAQSIGDAARGKPESPFAHVVEGLTGEPFADTLRLCGRDPERFGSNPRRSAPASAIR